MSALDQVIQWKTEYDRKSHLEFLENRNWESVATFWTNIMGCDTLPDWINGDAEYGVTNLKKIHEIGQKEFSSNDPKSKRKTFAFSIGYNGTKYHGYQQQKTEMDICTVEKDLEISSGRKFVAAGRTDKDVSAVSQIISFATFDDITAEQLVHQMKEAEPFKSRRLAVFDCFRVPRKFHPLFSATWRRYLYLLPLSVGGFVPYQTDVDINFVNRCLSKLEGDELPYNGFAFRDNRDTGTGLSDMCTLFRARAFVVDLLNCKKDSNFESVMLVTEENHERYAMCVELVGSRFLRRMVRLLVATAVRESVLPSEERDEDILHKICVSGCRDRASLAVPGTGLALCGVGYDLGVLSSLPTSSKGKKRPQADGAESSYTPNEAAIPLSNEARVNEQSRRRRYHERKQREAFAALTNSTTTNATNCSALDSVIFPNIQCSDEWLAWKEELLSYDTELLYYPQRAFTFKDFTLLANQSSDHVGSTIWDAEVVLAHYFDQHRDLYCCSSSSTETRAMLELGAGTALAAMVLAKNSAATTTATTVCIQERADVLEASLTSCRMNDCDQHIIQGVAGDWGKAGIAMIQAQSGREYFDLLCMADVFYHEEDFPCLCETIFSLLHDQGHCVVAFEQRRKNLSSMIQSLSTHFRQTSIIAYNIPLKPTNDNAQEEENSDFAEVEMKNERVTKLYLCTFHHFQQQQQLQLPVVTAAVPIDNSNISKI